MFKNKKVSLILVTALVLTLAVGVVSFASYKAASAAGLVDDGFAHRDGPGDFKPDAGREADGTYLAEALGITVEELQAANEAAQAAAVEQALADGLITQSQADRLANFGARALRLFTGPDSGIDMDALLAEALGINMDELTTARETAQAAAVEQAIADGKITAEQAALMEARQALNGYLEKDQLVAQALGLSVDELQAARDEGQRLPDLLEELGLDQATFQANLQATSEEALQQAVEDGILTQAQADLLLENGLEKLQGRGPAGHDRFPGGRGGAEDPQNLPGRTGNSGTEG